MRLIRSGSVVFPAAPLKATAPSGSSSVMEEFIHGAAPVALAEQPGKGAGVLQAVREEVTLTRGSLPGWGLASLSMAVSGGQTYFYRGRDIGPVGGSGRTTASQDFQRCDLLAVVLVQAAAGLSQTRQPRQNAMFFSYRLMVCACQPARFAADVAAGMAAVEPLS